MVRNIWSSLVCHIFHAQNLKGLVQHVNTVHYGQPNVDILCGINGCVSRYKSCKGWCNHVIRKHKEAYASVSNNNQTASVAEPHDTSPSCWVNNGDDYESQIDFNIFTPQERKKCHTRILLTFKEDNKLKQNTT